MGRIGRRIGDRYRLVEKLGTGGMSVVWRGYDEILGRDVAVKVLSPQLAGNDAFRDRLRQEALAAARLCHPHITGIFDFGESPLSDCLTVPYVVMELNNGESVGARVKRLGPLPWRDAVGIAAEVASALATAHARGVVHRDVTPANVMLTSAGAKVVDFGISALVDHRDAAPDGSLLGTPAYLAPERLAGGHVSPATDVYALGLLLYRSLTGRLPWPAENTTEALRAHLYADPEPLPSLPGLPDEVARLCLHCLAKNPADRPGAAEVSQRLGATIGLQPIILDTADQPTIPLSRPGKAEAAAPRPALAPVSTVLAYLGLPVPRRTRVLRLRAGLLIGSALRLGDVKPLGGGVFVGARTGRDVPRDRRSFLAGRHRLQATAASVALLAVVGLSWLSTREPAEVGPAQAAAAGAGAAAGLRHTAACKVRYEVERDSGDDFEAQVTVVNTGEHKLDTWRMEFAYPGTQRLTEPARAVAQNGRKVVVRGSKNLAPGRSVTVALRGAYRSTNPLPLAFTLDGKDCDAEVLGAVITPDIEAQPAAVEKPSGGSGGGSSKPERRATRPDPKPAPTKTTPKFEDKTDELTPPPVRQPQTSRVGGFSVAA
jgi:eukaryotic-like serine/threonine-protein kinase